MAALTNDGSNVFTMAGAMGAAVSMGLGVQSHDISYIVDKPAGYDGLFIASAKRQQVSRVGPLFHCGDSRRQALDFRA